MAHGLAMRTDGSHLRRIQPGGVKQLGHDVSVDPNQGVGSQCRAVNFVDPWRVQRQQLLRQSL